MIFESFYAQPILGIHLPVFFLYNAYSPLNFSLSTFSSCLAMWLQKANITAITTIENSEEVETVSPKDGQGPLILCCPFPPTLFQSLLNIQGACAIEGGMIP